MPKKLVPVRDAGIMAAWLATLNRSTQRDYKRNVCDFLKQNGGTIRQATTAEIAAHMASLSGEASTHYSRERRLRAIKSLYRFTSLHFGIENPTIALPTNRPTVVVEPKALTSEQVFALFVSAPSPDQWALLNLMYYAAMTSDEIAALKWADLTLRTKTPSVTIRGGTFKRRVPLPKRLCGILEHVRQDRDKGKPVFVTVAGRPMGARQVSAIVHSLAKSLELVGVSANWLRVSHAAHAIQRGATPPQLQASMGLRHQAVSRYFDLFGQTARQRSTLDLLPVSKT